jgi:hypothetical protein
MIYLFEDREDRMRNLLENKLKPELINAETKILISKNELDIFFNSLDNIQALLIHKSYNFPAKDITMEDIKSICKNKRIPVGLFSGGTSNAIIDENLVMCNSGDFYSNLNLFLTAFENNSKVNLPLLVFGNRYIINELKQLQIVVSKKIIQKTDIDILSLKFIRNDFETYLSAPELEVDKNKLIKWIESKINENKTIDSKIILDQLKKLIDKYADS